MVLLKIALFAFAAYYILKSVVRFLLPPALRDLEKKMRNQKQAYQNKKEGEVTIEKQREKTNNYGKGIGEYIDFEEIKD